MKRLMLCVCFLLFFVFGVSAQNSCSIYGSDGAIATLLVKGGKASGGQCFVRVAVKNYKKNVGEGRYVTVWVEMRERKCNQVVSRGKISVWIKRGQFDGEGAGYIGGLVDGEDYLFNIDNAVTCE